jgi:hypothetical protein
MVTMVMRNQQGVDGCDVATMRGKPELRLPTADPGIEEKPNAVCFNVDAIAVAAGLERDDFHRRILA